MRNSESKWTAPAIAIARPSRSFQERHQAPGKIRCNSCQGPAHHRFKPCSTHARLDGAISFQTLVSKLDNSAAPNPSILEGTIDTTIFESATQLKVALSDQPHSSSQGPSVASAITPLWRRPNVMCPNQPSRPAPLTLQTRKAKVEFFTSVDKVG